MGDVRSSRLCSHPPSQLSLRLTGRRRRRRIACEAKCAKCPSAPLRGRRLPDDDRNRGRTRARATSSTNVERRARDDDDDAFDRVAALASRSSRVDEWRFDPPRYFQCRYPVGRHTRDTHHPIARIVAPTRRMSSERARRARTSIANTRLVVVVVVPARASASDASRRATPRCVRDARARNRHRRAGDDEQENPSGDALTGGRLERA